MWLVISLACGSDSGNSPISAGAPTAPVSSPDINATVEARLPATLAAMPTPTSLPTAAPTPTPLPTAAPTPTPLPTAAPTPTSLPRQRRHPFRLPRQRRHPFRLPHQCRHPFRLLPQAKIMCPVDAENYWGVDLISMKFSPTKKSWVVGISYLLLYQRIRQRRHRPNRQKAVQVVRHYRSDAEN